MQLEEKRIPYTVEKITSMSYGKRPESYLKINPKGLVPAIDLDGKIYTDSEVISRVLEDEFPDHNPLLPEEQEHADYIYE